MGDIFSFLLKEATQNIGMQYFALPVAYGPPIYRERVYCYELYHQLRMIWPSGCKHIINGEVDKAGHPRFERPNHRGFIPDLLVHVPGDMAGNYAVIEIKNCRARKEGIEKDIETLEYFRKQAKYSRAIYLIYGSTCNRTLNKIRGVLEEGSVDIEIEVWCHYEPCTSAERKI